MTKSLDKEIIISTLIDITKTKFGTRDIDLDGDSTLEDAGLDSLDASEYSMLVQDLYDVNLEQKELEPNNSWYLKFKYNGMADYIIQESK